MLLNKICYILVLYMAMISSRAGLVKIILIIGHLFFSEGQTLVFKTSQIVVYMYRCPFFLHGVVLFLPPTFQKHAQHESLQWLMRRCDPEYKVRPQQEDLLRLLNCLCPKLATADKALMSLAWRWQSNHVLLAEPAYRCTPSFGGGQRRES